MEYTKYLIKTVDHEKHFLVGEVDIDMDYQHLFTTKNRNDVILFTKHIVSIQVLGSPAK